MEQTKNEPKNENKAAPDNGKPKKERKPLTEAQRLKRQKMIVLPAMVLVFIGAMWLISPRLPTRRGDRERVVTTSRCPTRTRRTARSSATRRKPTSKERWRNGRRTAAAPCRNWAICSTERWRKRTAAGTSTLPIPEMRKMNSNIIRSENHPIIRSRLPRPQYHARQLL